MRQSKSLQVTKKEWFASSVLSLVKEGHIKDVNVYQINFVERY